MIARKRQVAGSTSKNRRHYSTKMNEIIHNLLDEDYRKAEGFNASGLKKTIRSLAHWKADQDEKKEPTKALIFGIVFHHLLLTPDAPMRVVVKPDDFDGRSAAGKAWLAQNREAMTISAAEVKQAERMVESIRKHPSASLAFGTGKPEVSVFHEWKNPYTNEVLQLKGRMDFVNDGASIVDAKSCEDARPVSFNQDASEYGYFLQATFYCEFLWNPLCDVLGRSQDKKTDFVFVAVEKTPPYALKCYAVSHGTFAHYKPRIEEELTKYALAKASGYYPGYPEEVAHLTPSEWALRREVNQAMKLESTVSNLTA